MANVFQVDVVSPEATVWNGMATFLLAKTPDGELGIMANHEPLMGALVTGPVIVDAEDGTRTTIGVHGGFLQVLDNQVTLITDRAQIVTGGKDEAIQVAEELAADSQEADAQEADARERDAQEADAQEADAQGADAQGADS